MISACGDDQVIGPPKDFPSVEVSSLKIFYAYSSSEYHPFPDYSGSSGNIAGMQKVQEAFYDVWPVNSAQSFVNKLAPINPEINEIDLGSFTQILDYYTKFKERNQIGDNWDCIHIFGISSISVPQSDHAGGATIPYKFYENMTNGSMPPLVFINIGLINSMTTNAQDRVKIKAIISAHEIAHARGVNDYFGNELTCACSNTQWGNQCDHCCHITAYNDYDNTCALVSPFQSILLPYNFPPHFCNRHNDLLRNVFKNKLAKAYKFPENFCHYDK